MKDMNLEAILKKVDISYEKYKEIGLTESDLKNILFDYEKFRHDMESIESFVINFLKGSPDIKYVNSRLKHGESLIGKIIRKKIEYPDRTINIENYKEEVTDLIGVRALHLFKEGWIPIHDYIINNFELHEDPVAYVRDGDAPSILQGFKDKNLRVEPHDRGYRSIHYIIKLQPTKQVYYVEIQVRTIFEEAWSEIDHLIGYPSPASSPIIQPYIDLFNRLAGQADEMGSYLRRLDENEKSHKEELLKLGQQIKSLKIDGVKKDELLAQYNRLDVRYTQPLSIAGAHVGVIFPSVTNSFSPLPGEKKTWQLNNDEDSSILKIKTSKGIL